jgi:hypothetical protein
MIFIFNNLPGCLIVDLFKLLKLRKMIENECHTRESGYPLCENKLKMDSHFRENDNNGPQNAFLRNFSKL